MQEELKASIMQKLEEILPTDGGKDFVTAITVRDKLGKVLLRALKLTSNSKAPSVKEALTPYLDDCFEFRKNGKNTIYLTRKFSTTELVFRYIETQPGKSFKKLAQSLPMLKRNFVAALNGLCAHSHIIVSFNEKGEASFYTVQTSLVEKTINNNDSETGNNDNLLVGNEDVITVTDEDLNAFHTAFIKLDNGRLFVPITELRKTLSWPRKKFDEALRKLRNEKIIQLHIADRSKMTDEEWADVFVDENGYAMRRVTWHEKH